MNERSGERKQPQPDRDRRWGRDRRSPRSETIHLEAGDRSDEDRRREARFEQCGRNRRGETLYVGQVGRIESHEPLENDRHSRIATTIGIEPRTTGEDESKQGPSPWNSYRRSYLCEHYRTNGPRTASIRSNARPRIRIRPRASYRSATGTAVCDLQNDTVPSGSSRLAQRPSNSGSRPSLKASTPSSWSRLSKASFRIC